MVPVEVGPREAERHHVLELIAEAIRASRLLISRACPHPAAQILVQQPAIHDHVERVVRRVHLHSIEHLIPTSPNDFGCSLSGGHGAVAPYQLLRVRSVIPLSQQHEQPSCLPGPQFDARVEGRAWIQTRANPIRQTAAAKLRGPRQRTVPAQKFEPVSTG